jgi:hypothetical protein
VLEKHVDSIERPNDLSFGENKSKLTVTIDCKN